MGEMKIFGKNKCQKNYVLIKIIFLKLSFGQLPNSLVFSVMLVQIDGNPSLLLFSSTQEEKCKFIYCYSLVLCKEFWEISQNTQAKA